MITINNETYLTSDEIKTIKEDETNHINYINSLTKSTKYITLLDQGEYDDNTPVSEDEMMMYQMYKGGQSKEQILADEEKQLISAREFWLFVNQSKTTI